MELWSSYFQLLWHQRGAPVCQQHGSQQQGLKAIFSLWLGVPGSFAAV